MAESPAFAALIRAARARRGLDLEDAAAASGCSESYISLIETGKRLPSEELAVRLAQTLGIDSTEALLALLRARLPAAQRPALDPTALVREPALQLSVMREVLGAQLRARVARLHWDLAVDGEGGAQVTIAVDRLRPAAGPAPLKEFSLRDTLASAVVKPRILEAPPRLHFEIESEPRGDAWVHSICFPEGWVDDGGPALSFELQHGQRKAYELDVQSTLAARGRVARNHAVRWSFPAFVPALVETLVISASFPAGLEPSEISAWAWLGDAAHSLAPDNLIARQSCRVHELVRRGRRVELTIHEPLPLYSFALLWTPPDRSERLDARGLRA